MNPPADDNELKPEKLEKEKEGGALFHCDLYDADIVHKIAEEFLTGLASACVDNTTGGLFRNPVSVAVEIRREMVDYLIQRSENFVAESVLLDGGPNVELSEDPYDIVSDFVDDFANLKRNFFSRVSGWLLSEKREDRIDDFVQEMEINGFWLLNRRESDAQTILKNVDFKNIYHCSMSFKSPEDVEEHKLGCSFRTMTCQNEGCNFRFSSAQMDQHDLICPFKILKCEQNCSESIMRRVMDRHCITVCPMKLVNCPFYSIGCHSSIPQSTVDQHRFDNLNSHLLNILRFVHKEASTEVLEERSEELAKLSSPGHLAAARDARSLTLAIKDLEAKLGTLRVKTTAKSNDEVKDLTDKKEVSTGLPTKKVRFEESLTAKTESVNSPSKSNDSQENEKLMESLNSVGVQLESQPDHRSSVQQDFKESALATKDGLGILSKADVQVEKSSAAEPLKCEHVTLPTKAKEEAVSVAKRENHSENEESTKYIGKSLRSHTIDK